MDQYTLQCVNLMFCIELQLFLSADDHYKETLCHVFSKVFFAKAAVCNSRLHQETVVG